MPDSSDRSVKITRHFSESPVRIWQGWTDPKMMKQWFGSDPKGVVLGARVDLRIGGSFEVTFANSDGSRHTCAGTYNQIEVHRRLTFSWTWKDRPGPVELVTVHLEDESNGTRMEFQHSNIDPNSTHHYAAGWASTFDKLERAFGRVQADGA
jgi:uncharacterized protein YndB with AHSA1/START domain